MLDIDIDGYTDLHVCQTSEIMSFDFEGIVKRENEDGAIYTPGGR